MALLEADGATRGIAGVRDSGPVVFVTWSSDFDSSGSRVQGLGIEDILEAIVDRVPPPKNTENDPFRREPGLGALVLSAARPTDLSFRFQGADLRLIL